MNIFLGTTSQDKKDILIEYFNGINFTDFSIQNYNVSSDIVSQPLNEQTVIKGAQNRAINALKLGKTEGLGIGLEGGLTIVFGDDRYYLVCVAVIRDSFGNDFIGISSKLALPRSVSDSIKGGKEFGKVIREEASKINDISSYYQELISRKSSFKQAINNAFLSYFNFKD